MPLPYYVGRERCVYTRFSVLTSTAHKDLLGNFFSAQHQLNPPCYIQMQWNQYLVH